MWFFFVKQKTAYEMRISDWSSDVCSSDLTARCRLKVIGRELADETEQEQRAGRVQFLEIARAAAQILETRKAEHEIFSANLDRLDDLQSQHEAAKEALTAASESLTAITADREQLADQLEAGRTKAVEEIGREHV